MNTSENITEIAAALAAAQGEIEHATKDRSNPAFRSSYATLAAVDDACRPALTKHGIAIVSAPAYDHEARIVTVETRLIHKSGQWVGSSCSSPVAKADAQGIGSAITYLRRYTLSALAGVAPDDDDGNAATGREDRDERRPEPARSQPAPDPLDEARAAFASKGWTRAQVDALGTTDVKTLEVVFRAALTPSGPEANALHVRAGKRVAAAYTAGVLSAVVEQHGKPNTWSHDTVNKIKASLAPAKE